MKRGGQISGVVSLVMIFCSLCLCVFAVLTFSAADKERAMCEMTARSAKEYYAADSEAVAQVAKLKREGIPQDGSTLIELPVGTEQTLQVELQNSGGDIKIIRWQTVFTGDWETNDTIKVWDGN